MPLIESLALTITEPVSTVFREAMDRSIVELSACFMFAVRTITLADLLAQT